MKNIPMLLFILAAIGATALGASVAWETIQIIENMDTR